MRAYALPDFLVSAPDWTEKQGFEIKATVPAGATKEQFETMLQNLLIDRFKLAVHREPKEIARYELAIAEGGPKLKEAKEAPEPPTDAPPSAPPSPAELAARRKAQRDKEKLNKDGYPIRTTTPGWSIRDGRGTFYNPGGPVQGLILFLNMQMDKPVVDATGLKGTYEIVMHWVGMSGQLAQMMAQARAARGVPEDTNSEVGPSGPTLQQALRDQLGLKLESKRGPIDTLVVDHVEKAPTEN
jgi:uncharacterized protein (TIGR03435 family)